MTGSLAARLPWVAAHVGVGVGQLGLALLMPGIGAMLAMPFSSRLAHRHRLRPLLAVAIGTWCACLVLPSLPRSLGLLCGCLFLYGAASGVADMTMNTEGVAVEKAFGRSVMSSFHGFWSTGVLAGSAVSALASDLAVDPRAQFAVTSALLAVIGVCAARPAIEDTEADTTAAPPRFALPTRPVLLIGLIGLCAVFGEQAGTDWSALFIRRVLAGSAGVAALGVSAFALTMAIVRLVGDRMIRRAGPARTVQLSGACAGAGVLIVVVAPGVSAGLAGFALLGMGVALVVPIVFAAAGRIGPHPARSIAGAAGIAYGSGLLAPGMIGAVASASSLRVSFLVIGALVAAMAPAARLLGGGVADR